MFSVLKKTTTTKIIFAATRSLQVALSPRGARLANGWDVCPERSARLAIRQLTRRPVWPNGAPHLQPAACSKQAACAPASPRRPRFRVARASSLRQRKSCSKREMNLHTRTFGHLRACRLVKLKPRRTAKASQRVSLFSFACLASC